MNATNTVVELSSNSHVKEQYAPIVESLRNFFDKGVSRSLQWRKGQLNKLEQLVKNHQNEILQALKIDLGKSAHEGYLTEIAYTLKDIAHNRNSLKSWMKPKKVSSPIVAFPAKSFIQPEPLGVCLIIGAWNYPFQLLMGPLVAALAAGNCAIVKPSEIASATSSLLATLIPQYLDKEAIAVVEGGKAETSALLSLEFDKIFYTGGENVGKIVMSAAAKYLTPVTLELGGKSPCVVDANTNIDLTAKRIVWSKFMNAGQTCITPDYVLVVDSIKSELIDKLVIEIEKQYSKTPKLDQGYGRIINERHCERLSKLIDGESVVYGGEFNIDEKYFSPSIVDEPSLDSALMQSEIFGPILPIIGISDMDDCYRIIKNKPNPLAAYLFSLDKMQQDKFVEQVKCGNMCINDTNMFMVNQNLPFGGIRQSGLGSYHGKFGFDTFSHYKSVMNRSFKFDIPLRYPPFSKLKIWLLSIFLK